MASELLTVGQIARACCDHEKVILKGAMTGRKLTNYNARRETLKKYYDFQSPGFYAAAHQLNDHMFTTVVVIYVSGK